MHSTDQNPYYGSARRAQTSMNHDNPHAGSGVFSEDVYR